MTQKPSVLITLYFNRRVVAAENYPFVKGLTIDRIATDLLGFTPPTNTTFSIDGNSVERTKVIDQDCTIDAVTS